MIQSPTTPDFPNDNDALSAGTATPPDAFSLDSVPPPPNNYKGRTRGTKNKIPFRASANKSAAARARTHTNLSLTPEQQSKRGKLSLLVRCPQCQRIFSRKLREDDNSEVLGDAAKKILLKPVML